MGGVKPYKIVVVGLPKTGTSTLTLMLRMLGYQVTGPELEFKPGDLDLLQHRFETYDGFQDYPWCFEWELFKEDKQVLFIELKREKAAWWQSFYDSYGNKGTNYLAYPYFKIEKSQESQGDFLEFFEQYYDHFGFYKDKHPEKVLSVDIKTLSWEDLCDFLNEPLPKNILGKVAEKPHAKAKYFKERMTFKHRFNTKIRSFFLPVVGEHRWQRWVAFLRKSGVLS
ncbi:hypothetical protein GZ212_10315 [Mangrovimonas sp. CR14]|uniref:sulfotransferase n=1 Tax=Mangrovimonas sp. CR14 TaxID=2706120 RepID=UPI00141F065A|nr:sulfotransferase [Mangrovimonas sp. CR14]NIK92542.1 hypothetical protein [Mangrovimonas sp. CR14]